MRIIHTQDAPAAIGPYSQAVVGGGMCFASGQIPMDPTTGELTGGDIREQTAQALRNLRAVLRAANTDFDRVVKCTVFLSDMDTFAAMNEVYGSFFDSPYPARATVKVAGLMFEGGRIEIVAQAHLAKAG